MINITNDEEFEQVLEEALAMMGAPPAPGSVEEQRLESLLAAVSVYAPSRSEPVQSEDARKLDALQAKIVEAGEAWRQRQLRRAGEDGIGPTLGMDLGPRS